MVEEKLLCSRIPNIIHPSISSNDVETLGTNIIPFGGKKGYDLTRGSGANSCTTDQTNKTFSVFHCIPFYFQIELEMADSLSSKIILDCIHQTPNKTL